MKFFEIPGWETGIKIRRNDWDVGNYCLFDKTRGFLFGSPYINSYRQLGAECMATFGWEGWEVCNPAPLTKKVTLWRPIEKTEKGTYYEGPLWYISKEEARAADDKVVICGWESREFEVTE